MYTLNCNNHLIDLKTPRVMGVLNVTPDSFYDGGNLNSSEAIVAQAEAMLAEGATILDIGGYSSRPGAKDVSEAEEIQRVVPAIEKIKDKFPDAILSIDTFRSNVAKKAIAAGAAIVNDISAGLLDDAMLKIVGQLQVPYIMMHMRGTPQTMANLTEYEAITRDVLKYFSERIAMARSAGINDIIVDPGFGFSKTRAQNFELLNQLELFQMLDLPVLVGISRKSMIYKTLEVSPNEALNGTTALHAIAIMKGASLLRVHDVKAAMECITLVGKLGENP